MRYRASTRPLGDEEAFDAVVVPVFAGGETPERASAALDAEGGDLTAMAGRMGLREVGAHGWVSQGPEVPPRLLICVGPRTSGAASPAALRVAAMTAARTVRVRRSASLLALAGVPEPSSGVTVTEGWAMGAYEFDRYRRALAPDAGREVVMFGCDPGSVEAGAILGEAANSARDLVNTPGGDLPPSALAEECRRLGRAYGFQVRVVEGRDLVDGGFGGLVAVGGGSPNRPLLIEIERGDPTAPHVALVGKGITFDSGGLSLKSTRDMQTMKADMAGAAAVLGALIAAERLGARTHVKAYLACAENMPSGTALRIGDVIRHRNGMTTEVVDTDCEGRLVLSDVLAYAAEAGPTHVIDIATLSSSTGLGTELWAVLGTDRGTVRRLLAAGAASGEPGWELPLWDGYASRLRSEIADLRNYDPTITHAPGAVLAALYLRPFAGDRPWAHIDLGLTVMRTAPTSAWCAGANGNGTRTLARFLRDERGRELDPGSAHDSEPDNSAVRTTR